MGGPTHGESTPPGLLDPAMLQMTLQQTARSAHGVNFIHENEGRDHAEVDGPKLGGPFLLV